MKELPLITLGIPVYNAADLIERTLLSAFAQTYPNIEYILVDDKGNSMGIVHSVVNSHSRGNAVRIIDQMHNQGTGAARNTIVSHANGEYLFTMDCDDVIVPECIEILYRKMQEHPVDFVAASFVRKDLKGNVYPGGCQYPDLLVEGGGHAVVEYRYGQRQNIFVATWNKLYRTDFLRQNNIHCIPYFLIDDPWFTYQVILCARSCRLIPDCTLIFTYNPSSVTSVKEQAGYTDFHVEQYIETERLKANYMRPFAGEKFYSGLLIDTMRISIYHAYRTCASSAISSKQKNKLVKSLLKRRFAYPTHLYRDKNTVIMLLYAFLYACPSWMKWWTIRIMVALDLRRRLKDIVHFE